MLIILTRTQLVLLPDFAESICASIAWTLKGPCLGACITLQAKNVLKSIDGQPVMHQNCLQPSGLSCVWPECDSINLPFSIVLLFLGWFLHNLLRERVRGRDSKLETKRERERKRRREHGD